MTGATSSFDLPSQGRSRPSIRYFWFTFTAQLSLFPYDIITSLLYTNTATINSLAASFHVNSTFNSVYVYIRNVRVRVHRTVNHRNAGECGSYLIP